MSEEVQPLLPVEAGYRQVLRARLAIFWLPLCIGIAVLDWALLDDSELRWLPTVAAAFAALGILSSAPQRIYARLAYRLTAGFLQVVRGWLFHVDTIVPFVRVQHVDVTRGPFDKMFGTASLVVHTAGTHNSTVTLPGLAPERAAEIRDIIRQQVRTDFE